LKLLTDDLQQSDHPRDIDRRDILADVNVACGTTLDILNDLLCFDKMESGILVLHKHKVPLLSFISDCVSMFSAQAREGGVTISFVNGSNDDLPTCNAKSSSLLKSDTVLMDRFKMDQVLRNLISNALKFTPRGGSVTVSASYIPDDTVIMNLPDLSSTDKSYTDRTSRSQPSLKRMFSPLRFSFGSRVHANEKSNEEAFDVNLPAFSNRGKLIIVVKDTGTGMRKEDYTRLFKEIVQFNPEVLQAGGGSGLGLWITKGIVDLHGGKVSVHSDGLGLGSSFTLTLSMERKVNNPNTLAGFLKSNESSLFSKSVSRIPLSLRSHSKESSRSKEASEKRAIPEKRMKSFTFPLSPPVELSSLCGRSFHHLLIVDDSPLNRKMLVKTFRAAGHTCDEAEDGMKAIAKVKEKMESASPYYTAILMDFVMPIMDGPTATKAIRALGYTAPIFGVTGNTLDSDVDYFVCCGANSVLAKPLEMRNFDRVMEEAFEC
jgi:signal transduction histidine kinase/ActR/RegA family two-component response regulator